MTMTTALAPSSGTQLSWCQPQTPDQAWALAETIAKSRLAPKGYDTVEQIFVAMQHGAELGLNAMQSLQGIAMVNGRPAVWGTTLWALVQRSRIVSRWMKGTMAMPAVDKILAGMWKGKTDANAALVDALVVRLADRVDELKARKVTQISEHLVGYAVFQIEDDYHVQLFDSAHAQKAGLLGKSGPWTQYPERMHMHRAVTFLARDAAGSALTGIAGQPTAEEIMDMNASIETTATEARRPEQATVTVRMDDMNATPAGAQPTAPPPETVADAKSAAGRRVKAAIDRLKTLPWTDGQPLAEAEHRALISRTMTPKFGTRTVGQLNADERNDLADMLERINPPATIQAEAAPDPEPDPDGEPEDERTKF
jgi:hypothetical protein